MIWVPVGLPHCKWISQFHFLQSLLKATCWLVLCFVSKKFCLSQCHLLVPCPLLVAEAVLHYFCKLLMRWGLVSSMVHVFYFVALLDVILNFWVPLALVTTNLHSGAVQQMTYHLTFTYNLALTENYQQPSHQIWHISLCFCHSVLLSCSKRDDMMQFYSIWMQSDHPGWTLCQ